jgi:tetratricopeptide (TPR) repeat protein
MPHPSKDIYQTRERDRDLLAPAKPTPDMHDWFGRAGRNPWSIALLVLIGLGFLGGFLTLLLRQKQVREQAETRAEQAEAAVPETPPARILYPMDLDPVGALTEGEFEELATRIVPDGGPIALTPDWAKQAANHIRQAETAFSERNWQATILHYEKARAILPGLQGINRWIGLAQLRLKAYPAAEAAFSPEAEIEPADAGLRNNLGVARFGQDRLAEAEQDFQAALRLKPGYPPALRNLALLFYQSDRSAEALDMLSLYLTGAPDDVEMVHMKAVTLIKMEQWKEAALALEAILTLYPDNAPILFRLAEVQAHLPDGGDPVVLLKQATERTDARRALAWINRSGFDPLRDRPDFQALVLELSQAVR